jgi:hypothetical protein
MNQQLASEELRELLAATLRRPRVLKHQTLRHLEERVESESDLSDFLKNAAAELEDYQLEITFAPVFTPTFDEQVEVADVLTRFQPSTDEVNDIVKELTDSVDSCPITLPAGGTASLTLHEVLIERYVRMLHLDAAPAPEHVDMIREALSGDLVDTALTLMRQSRFTPEHQDWFARFLLFAADRHGLDQATLQMAADFLGHQTSLKHEDLMESFASLLRATIEAGSYAQKGRMYWSSDVAEHHQFRGQGVVDRKQVERTRQDVRVLEILKEDLESFGELDERGF